MCMGACARTRVFLSHLPSLTGPLSDVTAFTTRGTSLHVLEPSQWARQAATLPEK